MGTGLNSQSPLPLGYINVNIDLDPLGEREIKFCVNINYLIENLYVGI